MSKNPNITKSIKSESPKTPGGISISLLTPCRRVGLPRSWRKNGASPFVSPLSTSQRNTDEEQSTPHARNSRKRKKSTEKDREDNEDECPKNTTEQENTQTPTRAIAIRKRSKTLLSNVTDESTCGSPIEGKEGKIINDDSDFKHNEIITDTKLTPLCTSYSQTKAIKLKPQNQGIDIENTEDITTPNVCKNKSNLDGLKKSPQNLVTECVVVVQKEIFKSNHTTEAKKSEKNPTSSQGLFDSDSDDVPLCRINKNIEETSHKIDIEKTSKVTNNTSKKDIGKDKLALTIDKKTSTTDLKTITKKSKLSRKKLKTEVIKIESKPSSQSSFDEDDNDFDHRRTILVRKSYDKVTKPLKAKSTGSISDKDIEVLKSRIEVKKKLLLAKCLDSDTQDIRDLIKKWQRGCQDALVELMELMKKKMPDQPNMENAQILEMLKIPTHLVGYDSENDCFNPPNDTNIILSSLKM